MLACCVMVYSGVCRPAEECLTAVERIYSCNHPTLQPANKQKLEVLYSADNARSHMEYTCNNKSDA